MEHGTCDMGHGTWDSDLGSCWGGSCHLQKHGIRLYINRFLAYFGCQTVLPEGTVAFYVFQIALLDLCPINKVNSHFGEFDPYDYFARCRQPELPELTCAGENSRL